MNGSAQSYSSTPGGAAPSPQYVSLTSVPLMYAAVAVTRITDSCAGSSSIAWPHTVAAVERGLSVESFELCCRCSRPGCNAEVFTPAARGVRRRPEHLRLARERHKRAHPSSESLCHGPPNYCLYLRCERCSLGMGNQQARESGGAAAARAALVGLGGFSELYGV